LLNESNSPILNIKDSEVLVEHVLAEDPVHNYGVDVGILTQGLQRSRLDLEQVVVARWVKNLVWTEGKSERFHSVSRLKDIESEIREVSTIWFLTIDNPLASWANLEWLET
jgi:hypothetical protein